jgi:hypothetical protein
MYIQQAKDQYFTEVTDIKFFCYLIVLIYVIVCCCIFVIEPYITTSECMVTSTTATIMPNPLYEVNLCRSYRYIQLLYLTREECSYGRRLVSSVIYGGVVGWERRQSDRPAGVRTMVCKNVTLKKIADSAIFLCLLSTSTAVSHYCYFYYITPSNDI